MANASKREFVDQSQNENKATVNDNTAQKMEEQELGFSANSDINTDTSFLSIEENELAELKRTDVDGLEPELQEKEDLRVQKNSESKKSNPKKAEDSELDSEAQRNKNPTIITHRISLSYFSNSSSSQYCHIRNGIHGNLLLRFYNSCFLPSFGNYFGSEEGKNVKPNNTSWARSKGQV